MMVCGRRWLLICSHVFPANEKQDRTGQIGTGAQDSFTSRPQGITKCAPVEVLAQRRSVSLSVCVCVCVCARVYVSHSTKTCLVACMRHGQKMNNALLNHGSSGESRSPHSRKATIPANKMGFVSIFPLRVVLLSFSLLRRNRHFTFACCRK